MNARRLDRVTDVAIDVFMFLFRAIIILVVVVGSILTLLGGTYTAADWFELVGAGLTQGSIYAMIALGYTMVYGILRMINFAHGEIFMAGSFGGYFALVAMAQAGFLSENVLHEPVAIASRSSSRCSSRSSWPSASSASPTGRCGTPRPWSR